MIDFGGLNDKTDRSKNKNIPFNQSYGSSFMVSKMKNKKLSKIST